MTVTLASAYHAYNSIDILINHFYTKSAPQFLIKTEIVRINHYLAFDIFYILYSLFFNGLPWKECRIKQHILSYTV